MFRSTLPIIRFSSERTVCCRSIYIKYRGCILYINTPTAYNSFGWKPDDGQCWPKHVASNKHQLDIHCCVIDCNYPAYWLLHTTRMAHFRTDIEPYKNKYRNQNEFYHDWLFQLCLFMGDTKQASESLNLSSQDQYTTYCAPCILLSILQTSHRIHPRDWLHQLWFIATKISSARKQ